MNHISLTHDLDWNLQAEPNVHLFDGFSCLLIQSTLIITTHDITTKLVIRKNWILNSTWDEFSEVLIKDTHCICFCCCCCCCFEWIRERQTFYYLSYWAMVGFFITPNCLQLQISENKYCRYNDGPLYNAQFRSGST